jgi:hypothetical protein
MREPFWARHGGDRLKRPWRRLHPGTLAEACQLREAPYGDIDPAAAGAAIALLTPDAPAGTALGATTLTPDGWGLLGATHRRP